MGNPNPVNLVYDPDPDAVVDRPQEETTDGEGANGGT